MSSNGGSTRALYAITVAVLLAVVFWQQSASSSQPLRSTEAEVGAPLPFPQAAPSQAAKAKSAFAPGTYPGAKTVFQARYDKLPTLRKKALAIQEELWAAFKMDASKRETREYGSTVSAQQALYALDAVAADTVCEIGFYKGLGASQFLTANDQLVYHSFESGYQKESLEYFKQRFGSRFITHEGDSGKTVPAAHIPGGCQIIHIDGSHAAPMPYVDLTNMRKHAACDHLVLFDDSFECPGVRGEKDALDQGKCWESCNECDCYEKGVCNDASVGWWTAVEEGWVEHYHCFFLGTQKGSHGTYGKGWCVGRFKEPGACEA